MKFDRFHFILATTFTLTGLLAGLLLNSPATEAAFGTSPPWVKNDHMLPGTSFEQVINLSRSETDEAMQAAVKISGDKKLLEWITIEDKDQLIMKKGQTILPMKVIVKVPQRAEIKSYKGGIYVSLGPVQADTSLGGGEVAITLGAHIAVDITVIGEKITDYQVRSVDVISLQEGEPFMLKFQVENLGNTEVSELEGKVDIYDSQGAQILHSLDFAPLNDPISPDETNTRRMVFKDLILEPGQYWVNIKALKNGQITYENRLAQEVKAKPIPIITPKDVLSDKPALPGSTTESAPKESPVTVPPIIVQIPTSDLKSAAPATGTSNAYLILGLAGLGLGLVAIIGIIVVLAMVLKNQRQAVMNQPLASGAPSVQGQIPVQNATTGTAINHNAEEKK